MKKSNMMINNFCIYLKIESQNNFDNIIVLSRN